MGLYTRLVRPVLYRLDPETAHELTLWLLAWAQGVLPGRVVLRGIAGRVPKRPFSLWGLTFPNVLGVAAGFDKDVRVAAGLAMLGFGHVEVGTLTPRPQAGNPRPRIFRLPSDEALINRMGFPNVGVESAVSRLARLAQSPRQFVLGVSLGKQKETPLADAVQDYLAVMAGVYAYADYLAVNISSPNTPGLRALQGATYLAELLQTLVTERDRLATETGKGKRPLLVKIAPDLTWPELDQILDILEQAGIDGIVATNTTTSRYQLVHPNAQEQGGLSGRPLATRANEIIAYIYQQTNGRLPIIGVGGVHTADDARRKLDAGASLVQLYTGLVYEGPGIAGRILRQLYPND
ncbi:MAG: quinone-dependent dihydroorotate dehydrogenase [Chloroflexi bacterium]|nr:MAG: quinone-dependent dihydroorotate dehydrogenase [Chloroflexota bacterium]